MSDVILAKYRLELDGLKKDFDNIEREFKGNQKKIQKEAGATSKIIGQVGGVIAGAFAVDQLISFGKKIISITGEFQKMEAVLTNTLGSNSAAKLAMNEIVQFASTTPFQVKELTDAFVKLANQGFRPTQVEMRKLGDLAASTGKSFDQLTEALIDAQVGEFERLKEFGIRAQKQGDEVMFTFKGVQQQVEFTDAAIREYVLSLGDLDGVQGSTSAIAETLTGQLSMLQDSFDLLMVSIGEGSSGLLVTFIKYLNEILVDLRQIVEFNDGWYKSGLRLISNLNPAVAAFANTMDDVVEEQIKLNNELENSELAAQVAAEGLEDVAKAAEQYTTFLEAITENLSDGEEPFKTYAEQIKDLKDVQKFLNEDTEGYLNLQRQIVELEERRAKALENINDRLAREKELQKGIITDTVTLGETAKVKTEELNELEIKTVDMDEWRAKQQADAVNNYMMNTELQTQNALAAIDLVGSTLTAFGLNSKQAALLDIALSQAQIIAFASEAAAKAGAEAGVAAPVVTPAILASVLASTIPNVVAAYQIINSQQVPQFWEGAEMVEKALGAPHLSTQRDSYLGVVKGRPIRFDGKERILSAMDNKQIGKMSNDEVVQAVNFYKTFKGGNLFGGSVGMDYRKLDKIERKGALTVANEVRALRSDIKESRLKDKLAWH